MKVIDLSQKLTDRLMTFPSTDEQGGDAGTTIRILRSGSASVHTPWRMLETDWLSKIETSGYNVQQYNLDSHAGTHVDAPYHFFAKGRKVDDAEVLRRLVGEAVVFDVRAEGEIKALKPKAKLEQVSGKVVLLYTGWSDEKKFGSASYFVDFPTMNPDLAHSLTELDVLSVGVDTPSPDPIESQFEVHKILLGNDIPIIENLRGLGALLAYDGVLFVATPLKVGGGDASPVRAIAIVEGCSDNG